MTASAPTQPALASRFDPPDPEFAARVRASFGRQKAMALIGATLSAVAPGRCEIELPFRDELTQQKGYVHGGIIGMIADSACGYAAYTLMPADASLVTVEYKINILAPGLGRLVARGEVIRPGRTLSITRGEVYAESAGRSILCAAMQQTLMMLPDTPDTPE
ncbi:MAG: PaaI family thioesterase [Betaproteobacteria bacterium]|nr:PaaI family thioesterase [Betaproteobacteria bacterium]